MLYVMVVKVCGAEKSYNLYESINSPSLWKRKVFNAYSYLLYYSSVVLHRNYLNLPGVIGSVVTTMNVAHPCGVSCCQFSDILLGTEAEYFSSGEVL